MKTIKILSTLAFCIILESCNNQTKQQTAKQDKSVSKIEVIDFHSTHRCLTCNAIESNTKKTLETYFAKEMADGKIIFQSVNVDEPENEHLAVKFQATGTSLFLNIIVKGEEKQINLTDFAFAKARDKESFSKELKIKIENELANL